MRRLVRRTDPLLLAGTGAASAATTPSPKLGILFPEGMTARQMTDRVSAVRRIAIAKRHVRPVLNAKSYARRSSKSPAPRGFAGAKRGTLEGFLFPFAVRVRPVDDGDGEFIDQQLNAFGAAWSKVDLSAARTRGRRRRTRS